LACKTLEKKEKAERLEASLINFVQEAWRAIDPAEYQRCWAIDALCEHLQAVSEGQIRHLLVNAPPRTSKITLASIFYPAWTWAQSGRTFLKGPQVRFLCGSYNHDLSLTNSNSTRRLIFSPWYQSLWGQRFTFREDQNTKTKFDTSAGGRRKRADDIECFKVAVVSTGKTLHVCKLCSLANHSQIDYMLQ
jgi:hypothetical protein